MFRSTYGKNISRPYISSQTQFKQIFCVTYENFHHYVDDKTFFSTENAKSFRFLSIYMTYKLNITKILNGDLLKRICCVLFEILYLFLIMKMFFFPKDTLQYNLNF